MKMRVLGTTVSEDLHTAAEPLRRQDAHCGRAEDVPGHLLRDQADAEGDQQRVSGRWYMCWMRVTSSSTPMSPPTRNPMISEVIRATPGVGDEVLLHQ